MSAPLPDQALFRSLLTCDGRGRSAKADALVAILRAAQANPEAVPAMLELIEQAARS